MQAGSSSQPAAPAPIASPVADGEIKVFQPTSTQPVTPATELPDEYFEPTAEDVRRSQAALMQRNKSLNERGFTLAKDREAERLKAEKKKEDKWPITTIRIRFSDRTQIQKVFPSTSRIGAVYEFVRSSLNTTASGKPFTLYEPPSRSYPERTPPLPPVNQKTPIHLRKPPPPDPTKMSLMELQLVPQSVLVVRFEEDGMNRPDEPAPLLPELMSQAAPLPPPKELASTAASEQPSSGAGTGGAKVGGEKKVPKWLQKGLLKRK